MSAEQIDAILKRHEKLLWWMRDQERFTFIAELREDYLFEQVQECVAKGDGSMKVLMSENGEPLTPREEAEIKAELTVRDAWLAVTAACILHNSPEARPYIQRQRDDIMSMKTKLDLLASAIEVSRG
jgi:hypothetical protein